MKFTKILSLMLAVIVVCSVFTSVFADISVNFPSSSGSISKIDTSAKKIWGTVVTVVQILAFAAVVFAGIRYMFAAADQKADIKKGLSMLTIGALLVFAASTVVQFIVNAGKQIL